ncbi:hypothetical protein C5167_029257 [Papaver somniferum]|nr:hypothetical protein C5167_029257 [Papaver somniferum]
MKTESKGTKEVESSTTNAPSSKPAKSNSEVVQRKAKEKFNDLGTHGTNVIIYNLWFTDDGEMKLNFESYVKDIQLAGAPEMSKKANLQALCQ